MAEVKIVNWLWTKQAKRKAADLQKFIVMFLVIFVETGKKTLTIVSIIFVTATSSDNNLVFTGPNILCFWKIVFTIVWIKFGSWPQFVCSPLCILWATQPLLKIYINRCGLQFWKYIIEFFPGNSTKIWITVVTTECF